MKKKKKKSGPGYTSIKKKLKNIHVSRNFFLGVYQKTMNLELRRIIKKK